eukprot:COSAG01_NODE_22476_length_854_cov_1.176159_3_plen_56_part_00
MLVTGLRRHGLVGQVVSVSEAEGDAAGDNEPEGPITAKTRVETMLKLVAEAQAAA